MPWADRAARSAHAGCDAASDTGARAQALGNRSQPLRTAQVMGIWPASDFRTDPRAETLTYLLIALLIAVATAGLVLAYRRRAWSLLLYVATTGVGCLA